MCIIPIDLVELANKMKFYNSNTNKMLTFLNNNQMMCFCPVCGSRAKYWKTTFNTHETTDCKFCHCWCLHFFDKPWQVYYRYNKLIDYAFFNNGSPFDDDVTLKSGLESKFSSNLLEKENDTTTLNRIKLNNLGL